MIRRVAWNPNRLTLPKTDRNDPAIVTQSDAGVFVGCVRGAMASNVLTMTARGNVSYSVSLTTSTTLPSTLIVPQILRMTVRDDVEFDGFKSVTMLMLTVVLPVVARQLPPTLCRLYTSSCQHGHESGDLGDHCDRHRPPARKTAGDGRSADRSAAPDQCRMLPGGISERSGLVAMSAHRAEA